MSDQEDYQQENPEDEDAVENEEEVEEKEEEEEPVPDVPLTEQQLSESLSLLCKTGDGMGHAYVKSDLKEKELTDLAVMSSFIHLRYIDVSKNKLTNIDPLNQLQHLITLKADYNNLKSAKLDELPYLQVASFSHNKINTTEGVNHPMLESLNLSFNRIAEVSDLDATKLGRLHTLELRGNKLTSTDGIFLPNLKNLFLANNQITSIRGLDRMSALTTLHLRDNQIGDLGGFSSGNSFLQYINLRGNNITDLKELKKLQDLPKLRALVLAENGISEEDDYRMEVLVALRRVIRMDKDEYTEEERAEAQEIAEQRRQDELAAEAEENVIESDEDE